MTMTLDKAIEILNGPEPDIDGILNDDYKDAVKLGIEAMKREQVWRQHDPLGEIHLLPGETD